MAPIGRFTRKIQFHANRSVSTPPSSPRRSSPDSTKPKIPIALARSAGSVKIVITSDRATTETIAPPKPPERPSRNQGALRRGQPAGERHDREEREAHQEQAPAPVQVAEPAAQQQEATEGEQIGVHNPGERRLGEAQVRLDRWQGDVHDRRVEHDQYVSETEHVEREPAPAALEGRRCGPVCSLRRRHNLTFRFEKNSRTGYAFKRASSQAGDRRPATRRPSRNLTTPASRSLPRWVSITRSEVHAVC